MAFYRSHAGFNITNDKIQLVEIDYKEINQSVTQTGFYLENIDEEFFTEFLDLSFPETKIINILQNTFNEIILRKPLETNYVSFSLPNNFFKIFQLPLDSQIASKDLSDHLRWEISVMYPNYDPDSFVIRHIENSTDTKSGIINAIVFAVNKKFLKMLHKFCVRNNLILKYVDNAHISADAFLTSFSADKDIASVLLDEKSFSISIMRNKKLKYFKSMQINSITDFLEKLKEEFNDLPSLKNEVNETDIYISGNFVSDNLINKLKEESGYNFLILNPLEKIKLSASLNMEDVMNKNAHKFSSAAGIALRLV